MRKKLFLLMVVITPCLSWAADSNSSKKTARNRAPASAIVCEQAPVASARPSGLYGLGTKDQVNAVSSGLTAIVRKQNGCDNEKSNL